MREPADSTYLVYPQPGQKFVGLVTDVDPTFVPDTAAVNGQNTFCNDGDRITTRPFGLSLFPSSATVSTTAAGIASMWTFRIRTGENIMLRAYSTVLEWFDENTDAWANLRSALSSSDFGFAEFNVNANAESRLYHGNAVDDFAYWNGGHTNLNGALTVGATTTLNGALTAGASTTLNGALVGAEAIITVVSTTGFAASGSILIGVTVVTYTGVTATTFTGCVGTPAALSGASVKASITITVVSTTGFASSGSIYIGSSTVTYTGTTATTFTGSVNAPSALDGASVQAILTLTVDSTSSFSSSGSLRIGTTTVTYTGVTATTFTGALGVPTAADNTPVAQAVTTDGSAPKANIYMAAQNRLFMGNVATNQQIIVFSAYGDASSWSTTTVLSSTATSAGAFNLVEGGGGVTAMSQDEKVLYFYKKALTYSATLTDELYSLQVIKPFEGRSRATGALGKRGVFIGGNFTFIVTPDNQLKALERVETIDYPQLQPISQPIQPTVTDLDFTSVAGISFKEYAYFACKSSSAADFNDTVLPFNLVQGHFETPISGWQVGEWTIYDDGTGEKLYFGDAVSPNVWLVDSSVISDGPYQITSSWKTKQYDFGTPAEQKELDDVYVEGYINPSTTLRIRLLYDEDGYTGIMQTDFVGTETTFILDTTATNSFGLLPFGTNRFGANEDLSGLRKFRIHLTKKVRHVPFYNCQLEFSSSGQNQQWEVVKYGFKARPHSQPMRSSLMRDFS